MKSILKLTILTVIAMGICSTSALAYVCETEPNNCSNCTWQLSHCDTEGTPDFTDADAATNPDNPCYPYCS
jgi:hypothetical protein